jgi:hypothetical protein
MKIEDKIRLEIRKSLEQSKKTENLEEDWKNLALGGAMALSSLANAQTGQKNMDINPINKTGIEQSTNNVVQKGGVELGKKLIDVYNKNPKAAEQWQKKHSHTSIVDVIKSVINIDYSNSTAKGTEYENNDFKDLGNQYKDSKDASNFIAAVSNNAFSMEENQIRLEIRKLVSEVFSKGLGLGSGFDDEDLNKKSKMAGWLDKKPTSRTLYSAETIKEMLDDAILMDDWDIINDIVNNVSFRKLGYVPEEIEDLGDSLADASNESSWHKVALARKQFKNYVPSSINENLLNEMPAFYPYNFTDIKTFDELSRHPKLLKTDLGLKEWFDKYVLNHKLTLFEPHGGGYSYLISMKNGNFKEGFKFNPLDSDRGEMIRDNEMEKIPHDILTVL